MFGADLGLEVLQDSMSCYIATTTGPPLSYNDEWLREVGIGGSTMEIFAIARSPACLEQDVNPWCQIREVVEVGNFRARRVVGNGNGAWRAKVRCRTPSQHLIWIDDLRRRRR